MRQFIYLLTFRSRFKCSENDDAEDVLGALEETMNLNWTSGNRILFHIADSPHHGKYLEFILRTKIPRKNSDIYTCVPIIQNYTGRRFNDPKKTKDKHPKGIKGETKLSDLLTRLIDTNISYLFGEVKKGNLFE